MNHNNNILHGPIKNKNRYIVQRKWNDNCITKDTKIIIDQRGKIKMCTRRNIKNKRGNEIDSIRKAFDPELAEHRFIQDKRANEAIM